MSESIVTESSDNGKPAESAPDPFAPDRIRLAQDFNATCGVKKELITIPVRKPTKAEFVRVHPDEAFRISTAVLELKEERETYWVDPSLHGELATSEATFSPRALFTAMNRQNVLFIWPVRLPGPDGKTDEWSRSSMEAAERATRDWVRVTSNMSLGAYEMWIAQADLPEPEWPADKEFSDLLRIAFRDKCITSLDHPVLKKLRGEV